MIIDIIKALLIFAAGYWAARAHMVYLKQKETKIYGYTKKELIEAGKKRAKYQTNLSRRINELEILISERERLLRIAANKVPYKWVEELESWRVELRLLKPIKTGCKPSG